MKMNNRKHLVLAAGALALGCVQAAGWNPATRTYDTTGCWTQKTVSWPGASLVNPTDWRKPDGTVPEAFESDAGLYATQAVYANPDADKVTAFPCSALALAGSSTLYYKGSSAYFDFGRQVDLLEGASLSFMGGCFRATGTFNFYSTAEKPNSVKVEAPTTGETKGYFLKDVTLTGDDQAFVVLGGAKAGCTFANFTWESGGGTAFHGTLRVANFPTAPADCVAQLKLADIEVGGTVSLSNNTRLVLCGATGATVSNLVMDAGSVLVGTTAERKLTVNGKVTTGEGLRLDISGLSATGNETAASWPILKFAPTADLTGFACEDVVLVNGNDRTVNAEYCLVELREDADGGKTLLLVKPRVVTRTTVPGNEYRTANADNDGYRSEFQFAQSSTTKKDFWSDGSYPTGDAAAEIVYAANARTLCFPTNMTAEIPKFPGALLSLRSSRLTTSSWTPGWLVPQMRFAGMCGIRLCDAAGYRDPAFMNEDGQVHSTMRLQGALDLGDSPDVTDYVEIYGSRLFLCVESLLCGKANLELRTYPSVVSSFLNATLELAGDNSKWRGKLLVKGLSTDEYKDYEVDGQTVAYPNRRKDGHCRLYLANAAGLGGRRADFAYDALALRHYGEVFLRNDVTLPAGLNRGVSFGDYSTLNVTNGLTFTILQPTTWAGTVYKVGAGRLALGCAPKFNGAEQADRPTEGQNVLEVEGGSVEPLAADALNGVAVRLADKTCRIAFNADEVGAAKGLVNVKAATPFATKAADGKIRFEARTEKSAETVADGLEVALCTVSASAAEALRGKVDAGRLCGRRGKVFEQANDDGTVTFRARYQRWGVCVIIR